MHVPKKEYIIAARSAPEYPQKDRILKTFNKIKGFINAESRKLFSLELWDNSGLFIKEKELGIRVTIDN